MNKKKWLIGASIFGMVVSGSAGVLAGSQLPEIKAYLNNQIGISVNDKDFKPVDDKGNALHPITYNNATYLPVRAVSEALDVSISYDQAAKRVYIHNGEQGTSKPQPTTPKPSENVSAERPQYLPADFPLPDDFKKIDLIESGGDDGSQSVYFTLQTKESVQSLVEQYNQYLKARGHSSFLDLSKEKTIHIISSKAKESVSINGGVISEEPNVVEYTIIWSAD